MSLLQFTLIYLAGSVAISLFLGAVVAIGSDKTEEELEFEKEVLEEEEVRF